MGYSRNHVAEWADCRARIVRRIRPAIVAVGIVAVAGTGGGAAGQERRDDSTAGDRFGRLFDLPAFDAPTPDVKAALTELGKRGGLMDAPDNLSAGPVALIVDPELSRNNPNSDACRRMPF